MSYKNWTWSSLVSALNVWHSFNFGVWNSLLVYVKKNENWFAGTFCFLQQLLCWNENCDKKGTSNFKERNSVTLVACHVRMFSSEYKKILSEATREREYFRISFSCFFFLQMLVLEHSISREMQASNSVLSVEKVLLIKLWSDKNFQSTFYLKIVSKVPNLKSILL